MKPPLPLPEPGLALTHEGSPLTLQATLLLTVKAALPPPITTLAEPGETAS